MDSSDAESTDAYIPGKTDSQYDYIGWYNDLDNEIIKRIIFVTFAKKCCLTCK